MTIMTHKDCEEWAAMIAQMQDDPSWRPKHNKKGVEVTKDRGPNDLEEQIQRLEFRNEKLHQHNEKLENEIIELRTDNKKLAKQCEDLIDQYRNKGAL
jgi:predicted RNase H-like nuclease (RuvC/YqgF family)